jgi:hypothetical protein
VGYQSLTIKCLKSVAAGQDVVLKERLAVGALALLVTITKQSNRCEPLARVAKIKSAFHSRLRCTFIMNGLYYVCTNNELNHSSDATKRLDFVVKNMMYILKVLETIDGKFVHPLKSVKSGRDLLEKSNCVNLLKKLL